MKTRLNKEIIIGFVTLISLGLLFFGLNYLKGKNIFKPTNHYFVRLPNVNELQKSGPVYVDGFKVGIVSDINYGYENNGELVAMISLDKKMKIEKDSYVEIKVGLTSGAYLNLVLNKYVSSYYQTGDTIDGVSEKGLMDKLANDLLPQVENLLPRLDSILLGIQVLVNHPALLKTLDNFETTTSNLEVSTRQLNSILSKDIPPILANLNQVSSDFTSVSSQFKKMDLNATLNKVDRSVENLEQLSIKLNSKDNSLGLLLNDRSVYDNLDSTFVNASNLLLDLRLNPKRYVHFSLFGRQQ